MSHYIKILFASIVFVCTGYTAYAQPADITGKVFTTAQLQQDFSALRNRYQNSLANLYLYCNKTQLDSLFDSLYAGIKPMTAEQFYGYITPLSSVIKDGHSNLYPPEELTQYHNANSVFFPFAIQWQQGHLYVVMNLSNDTTIKPGSEIVSINGINADGVMEHLLNRQVRDGYNDNYARWILNSYFREYYSYHFGHPSTYNMVIKDSDRLHSIVIDGLSKELISTHKAAIYKVPVKKNMAYSIDAGANYAVLNINTWDDAQFKQQTDHLFSIIMNNVPNLIIDLRDNQGGNAANAIYLLSYLLNTPFEYFTEAKSVKQHTAEGQVLQSEKWNALGIHQPQKQTYQGKVFVLINGGSFSNSAAFCSRIAYYNRAQLIGEETGGNKAVFSGNFGLKKNIVLPNTRIICENTDYRLTVTDTGSNNGRGVLPAYTIAPTISSTINNTDTALTYTLSLIKTK